MLQVRVSAVVLICGLRSALSFTATSSLRQQLPRTTSSLHRPRYDRIAPPLNLNALPPANNQELHLITFDLDDTIFPIGPVVADANVAQLQTLIRYGYDDAANEEIIAASKQIRTEIRDAGTVITYSDLRKQSIRREIKRVSGLGSANGGGKTASKTTTVVHDSVVDAVFDAWLSERHASADRNLFPHASDALKIIREEHPTAVVGAITNGRGNPLEMPSLEKYFDFCVSGEDDGVFPRRKPDKGIYQAAIRKYEELQDGGRPTTTTTREEGDDGATTFNWIHVGDDLANDVGAGAACGAKSIWFKMEEDGPAGLPSWSTATEEELVRRAAMDQVAKEYVAAMIVSLEELPGAIAEVLDL